MQVRKAPSKSWMQFRETLIPVINQMGIAKLAAESGISREHLYKVLSDRGNPEFATLVSIIKACGMKLMVCTD